jgi:hypothetical protein
MSVPTLKPLQEWNMMRIDWVIEGMTKFCGFSCF